MASSAQYIATGVQPNLQTQSTETYEDFIKRRDAQVLPEGSFMDPKGEWISMAMFDHARRLTTLEKQMLSSQRGIAKLECDTDSMNERIAEHSLAIMSLEAFVSRGGGGGKKN